MTYVLTHQRYIKLPVHNISHTGTGDIENNQFEGNNKPKGLNKFPRRQNPGRFGPIPVRSGRFGPGRFGPIFGMSRFGPDEAGRFGPIS